MPHKTCAVSLPVAHRQSLCREASRGMGGQQEDGNQPGIALRLTRLEARQGDGVTDRKGWQRG